MPELSMVERVARTVRTYGVCIWGNPWHYAVVKMDDSDTPIVFGLSAENAYAKADEMNASVAIEAMREPTEAMADKGGEAFLVRYWRAMIDEALRDPRPEGME